MFLKISEFKKAMKSALKSAGGLIVGNEEGHILVRTDFWGVWVEVDHATSKFNAAIVELIGDMPDYGTKYRFYMNEKELCMEHSADCFDPYEEWKRAKDFACMVPLALYEFPHETLIYQRHSDRSYITVRKDYSIGMLSDAELESGEGVPARPSVSMRGVTLFFKNEVMIYWVSCVKVPERTRDTILDSLGAFDFFEDSWLPKEPEESSNETEELPY